MEITVQLAERHFVQMRNLATVSKLDDSSAKQDIQEASSLVQPIIPTAWSYGKNENLCSHAGTN